jgi:DNA-binding NtrC family response regulator
MVRTFLQSKNLQPGIRITKTAMEELQRRSWPGNVRQLKLTIEKSAMKASGGIIQYEDLPPESPLESADEPQSATQAQLESAVKNWTLEKLEKSISQSASVTSTLEDDLPGTLYEDFLSAVEPGLLKAVLDHHAGNRAAAANTLGLHRSTLRQKTRKYHLEADK